MPPPTSCNPVPHIYFPSWETGVHRYLCTVQRAEISPPITSCSLCGAFPFHVNLCRNRRLHKENNIIRGSLCLERWVWLVFNPLLPGSVNREQLYPVCHISLLIEKKYSSPFSPVHPEIHLPTPVYSTFHISVPISYLHFHLKAPYCIYILWLYQIFFTVNVFVLHPILLGSLLVALMWNVCAEPIECCVYIKATLFLTTLRACPESYYTEEGKINTRSPALICAG